MGADRSGEQSIWDLVQQFNMYDVLALVYAIPHLSWRFFEPAGLGPRKEGALLGEGEDWTAVRLVGLGPKQTGIKDEDVLREFVFTGLLEGLGTGRSSAR
jgi:hypothetical protein